MLRFEKRASGSSYTVVQRGKDIGWIYRKKFNAFSDFYFVTLKELRSIADFIEKREGKKK